MMLQRLQYCSDREIWTDFDRVFEVGTMWKVSKYLAISVPYFPVFNPNTGKCRPEITPYLDTFHAEKMNQELILLHQVLHVNLTLIIDECPVWLIKTLFLILLRNARCKNLLFGHWKAHAPFKKVTGWVFIYFSKYSYKCKSSFFKREFNNFY